MGAADASLPARFTQVTQVKETKCAGYMPKMTTKPAGSSWAVKRLAVDSCMRFAIGSSQTVKDSVLDAVALAAHLSYRLAIPSARSRSASLKGIRRKTYAGVMPNLGRGGTAYPKTRFPTALTPYPGTIDPPMGQRRQENPAQPGRGKEILSRRTCIGPRLQERDAARRSCMQQ